MTNPQKRTKPKLRNIDISNPNAKTMFNLNGGPPPNHFPLKHPPFETLDQFLRVKRTDSMGTRKQCRDTRIRQNERV